MIASILAWDMPSTVSGVTPGVRAIVNTCGWGCAVGRCHVGRGLIGGGGGPPLLVGENGNDVLVEEVVDGDGLVAVRAWAADADAAGEDAAGWAALLAEEAFVAAGALVDGEVPPGPGGWDGDGGAGLLVAAPERGLAAGGTAVGLAAGRSEVSLADRA